MEGLLAACSGMRTSHILRMLQEQRGGFMERGVRFGLYSHMPVLRGSGFCLFAFLAVGRVWGFLF